MIIVVIIIVIVVIITPIENYITHHFDGSNNGNDDIDHNKSRSVNRKVDCEWKHYDGAIMTNNNHDNFDRNDNNSKNFENDMTKMRQDTVG